MKAICKSKIAQFVVFLNKEISLTCIVWYAWDVCVSHVSQNIVAITYEVFLMMQWDIPTTLIRIGIKE